MLGSQLLQQSHWLNTQDFVSAFEALEVLADEWNQLAIGARYGCGMGQDVRQVIFVFFLF